MPSGVRKRRVPKGGRISSSQARGSSQIESEVQEAQIRPLVRPLEKAWLITSMLAEVMSRAIKDGAWQDEHASVSEVLVAFSHDGPLGTVYAW
eukprot:CAMPEP_0119055050 /NCGR_PEP_ID=MMETSP1177-20130426/75478_1 /TAXON_ID=2985 /ORGANISM="Ochromonas sp, Strain CCMP1899" /LENGTH=92 /DNA_ID=CAMNT_0007035493 /DNA_START=846 /DNA_END=1121 /DNA_ORIENTATION=-